MAKKLYNVVEIGELLVAAAAIEDQQAKAEELNRIAALPTVKDEQEAAAISEKIKAAFEAAGFELPAAEPEAVELVKLVAKTSFGGPLGSFAPGDEIEVPADVAASWVEHGLAKKA